MNKVDDVVVDLEISEADMKILVKHGLFEVQTVYALTEKGRLVLETCKPPSILDKIKNWWDSIL